jgi:hypothetical protein
MKPILKSIESIQFFDQEGKLVIDARDTEPTLTKRNFVGAVDILSLVKCVYPSYELASHPLISKYGFGTFGSEIERWHWNSNINSANTLELWKIYGMISADWSARTEYLYQKIVKEYRDYMRKHGDLEPIGTFQIGETTLI